MREEVLKFPEKAFVGVKSEKCRCDGGLFLKFLHPLSFSNASFITAFAALHFFFH